MKTVYHADFQSVAAIVLFNTLYDAVYKVVISLLTNRGCIRECQFKMKKMEFSILVMNFYSSLTTSKLINLLKLIMYRL